MLCLLTALSQMRKHGRLQGPLGGVDCSDQTAGSQIACEMLVCVDDDGGDKAKRVRVCSWLPSPGWTCSLLEAFSTRATTTCSRSDLRPLLQRLAQ